MNLAIVHPHLIRLGCYDDGTDLYDILHISGIKSGRVVAPSTPCVGSFDAELSAQPTKTSKCNAKSLTRVFIARIDASNALYPFSAYFFHIILLLRCIL